MSRFVRPDTATLTISNDDRLTVKKRLNAGERRRLFAAMYRDDASGGRRVDPVQTGICTVVAYLLDWTLRDDAGLPVVIRDQPLSVIEAAVDALDPDSFTEILRAIEAHENAMDAERAEEQKKMAGASGS